MLEIRSLSELSETDLRRAITGYVSREKYQVSYTSTEQTTTFSLELASLAAPYVNHIDISYYTNTDFPDGEMAVFMKRRL